MFLEEYLNNCKAKENVMVLLNSATIYGIGECVYPVARQDCCGNHYTENWLKAIENCNLEKTFNILASGYDVDNEVHVLTVDKARHDKVSMLLDSESNSVGMRWLW